MSGRSDLIRTAANVFLTEVRLEEVAASGWRRALLAGAGDKGPRRAAEAELRRAAPGLLLDTLGAPGAPGGVRAARRRGYDVACLLLTGEGRRREKLTALLSGAPDVLARGRGGRWYRVRLPEVEPASPRWWARVALAGLLSVAYCCAVAALTLVDAARRLAPLPAAPPDPGPPAGSETTFIVPTYNQRALMDFCLPPLLAEAGREHPVLVVDDASADGTAEYVRRAYPSVRVVRLPRNRGFAGAVRAGVAASYTPLFALINSDVQVRPGFLRAMLPHFSRPDTFAVCSRIEMPGGSQVETGNAVGDFCGILEPRYAPPGAEPGPILYASGACSIFHRARYDALGGLEVMYRPLYWEDTELGYRAWRRGWRSLLEPRASALHQRRAWIGRRFGDAYANEMFLRNALLFVWKNVHDPGMLAEHLVYVCARLARELPSGEATMCRAALRALALLPRALQRRWAERRRGDLGDREILAISRPEAADVGVRG